MISFSINENFIVYNLGQNNNEEKKMKNTVLKTSYKFHSCGFLWLCLCLYSTAGLANYDLNVSAIVGTEGLAQEIKIGDVSGDGINDIVLVNNGFSGGNLSNHVLIYVIAENGGLSSPQSIPYSENSTGQRGLALVNMDDDDALEIVIGHDKKLTFVNQDLAGQFMPETFNTTFSNDVLAVTDLNLDNRLDLVSVQVNGNYRAAVVYEMPSLMTLSEINLSNQGSNFIVKTTDVNNDAKADLVIQNQGSSLFSDFSVFLHDGVDSFLPADAYSVGFNDELTSGLASGDFNNDGLNDVLISNNLFPTAYLFQQNQLGQLLLEDEMMISHPARQLQSSDLNTDNLTDVVLLHRLANNGAAVGFMLQNSTGLTSEQLFTLPNPLLYNPQAMDLGDINQDGCTDVVIADYNQGLIVLQGQSCQQIADLAINIRASQNQLLITGQHLIGEDVSQTQIDVVIQTDVPVNFIHPGCQTVTSDDRNYRAHCFIGAMSEGQKSQFRFNLDQSQIIGLPRRVIIYARISSELLDDNLNNNEQTIYLR